MRLILSTIIGLTVVIGGYVYWWNQIADQVTQRAEKWKQEKVAEGYKITNSPIDVSGFPYRVKLGIHTLSIGSPDPARNDETTINDFWAVTQPWNITHVIFGIDGSVNSAWNENDEKQTADLDAKTALGSATFDISGKLKNLAIDISEITFKNSWGNPVLAERLQLHSRPALAAKTKNESSEPTLPANQMALQLDNINVEGNDVFTGMKNVKKATLSGILQGDWKDLQNKDAISHWRDRGGIIDIDEFAIIWDESRMQAKGTIALDQDNRPMGAFTAHVVGFNQILETLVLSNKLEKKSAQTVTFALNLLAKENKAGERYLDIPISLQDGGLFLGPLHLMALDPLFE